MIEKDKNKSIYRMAKSPLKGHVLSLDRSMPGSWLSWSESARSLAALDEGSGADYANNPFLKVC